MPAEAIDDDAMPSQTDDLMPSVRDTQPTGDDVMPSHGDEEMPSQQLPGLPFITIPSKWKLKPDLGVHQPSQSSSGFFGPPSNQNADDWSFTTATAPKILNNTVTRGIGSGMNFVGQALAGDAESMLFSAVGDKPDANHQLIATAENMMPSTVPKDRALGIAGTNPYEDARATLPALQQTFSGIGPALIQTAPQLALTAVQPELGAASFGFTPQGFDPVEAGTMMVAPIGGKILGGVAGDLAARTGINNASALDIINRLGGGAGVASIISAPTAYQIAQMQPGPVRNEAIQDATSNAILTAILGGIGSRDTLPETANVPAETAGADVVPEETSSTIPPTHNPISEQDNPAAAMKNLQDMLRASLPAQEQQTVNVPADKADEIIGNVFPAEKRPASISDQIPQFPGGGGRSGDLVLGDATAGARQTLSPAAGSSNVPVSQPSNLRTTATLEPHYILSPDGTGGLDHLTTQAGINEYQRRQKNVPQVQIVNEPTWTHNGYGVRGTVQDGKIIVNRAFVDSAETLQHVLREEHNHALLSSEEGRAFIRKAAGANLGDAQYAPLAKQYPRQLVESITGWQARLADEFIAKTASENIPVWKQIVERVKTWLAGKGIGRLSDEETARAIMRALRSGQTAAEFSPRLLDIRRGNDDFGWRQNDDSTPDSAQKNGEIVSRYNLTDEPLQGMSRKRVAEAINEFLGTRQLPSSIRVARDRNDLGAAKIGLRGNISLNAAQISAPEQAQQAMLRQGLGDIWYQQEIQKAWQRVRSSVTPDEMKTQSSERQALGLRTDPTTIQEEAAIRRVITSDGRNGPVGNLHNAIRAALKKRFNVTVPATAAPQLNEVTIQFLRNRTALPSGTPPSLALVPRAPVTLGKWGEMRLDQILNGAGIKQPKPLKTSLTYRKHDQVVNRIAHESKGGIDVRLGSKIRAQILKDAELIRRKKVKAVHWHFFQGAQPDLLKFLEENGIGYTLY